MTGTSRNSNVTGLDLSSWEVAYTGAERVQDRRCGEFEACLRSATDFTRDVFCPCYGLAETTLLTTGSVKGEPVVTVRLDAAALQHAAWRSSRGRPARRRTDLTADRVRPSPSMSWAAAFPTRRRRADRGSRVVHVCEPDQVGEIWVAGATVTPGYWGQADATRETFAATLARAARRRTGDANTCGRAISDSCGTATCSSPGVSKT